MTIPLEPFQTEQGCQPAGRGGALSETEPAADGLTTYGRLTYPILVGLTVDPPLNQPWYGIGMRAAVKRGFKKCATFSGRASRAEFWWFWLVTALVEAVWLMVAGADVMRASDHAFYSQEGDLYSDNHIGVGLADVRIALVVGAMAVIWALACFVPTLAVAWRRMHDGGHSGVWAPIGMASTVAVVVALSLVGAGYPAGMTFLLLALLGAVLWLIMLCQPASLTGSLYDQPGAAQVAS
ncbi:MAG: DUF805 domain-containing protein [Bifidobacteriaceae bacterium]|nr:DUF805 domain-containing protein [Bifidobacteriaceae bacterium]